MSKTVKISIAVVLVLVAVVAVYFIVTGGSKSGSNAANGTGGGTPHYEPIPGAFPDTPLTPEQLVIICNEHGAEYPNKCRLVS